MYPTRLLEGQELLPLTTYSGSPQPIVGVRGVGNSSIGFDDAALGRHVLFLGGIGTGKTVGMTALVSSIRAAAGAEDVFVFFDTKGDYIERFFRPGDVSLSSAPRGTFPGSETWNMFREVSALSHSEQVEQITELCASLLEGVDDQAGGHNRIWTAMAQDLLAALVVAYVRSGKPFSNADLRAISDKLTVDRMRRIIEPHSDLHGTLQYIAKDDSNTTISVLIFLQQAIRQVFSAAFKERGDFAVSEFLKTKGGHALFLQYDIARGAVQGPVYRTLLDLALKESLGRGRAPGRVFMILDEFSLLPKLRLIDAGLNFGRSLGMRFVVGTQNVGQLRHAYGDGLAGSILAGFGTVFAFRLYDQPSRDYVRDRSGRNRKIVHYDTAVKARGVGEQLVEGNVIEDWELSGLDVGQCVVGLPGGAPWRFDFAPPA